MLYMTGSSVDVQGAENVPSDGGVVIVANHQGALDIPLMLGFLGRPIAFVAKAELRKVPLMGSWMKQMGCQFLDRNNRRQGLEVFKQSVAFLEKGGIMVVFPEGTRSRGGPLGEFKKGSLRMATKAGIPVVPVTIVDSYKIREANNGWIRPTPVKVIISKPIVTKGMDKVEQGSVVAMAQAIIAENLENN